MKFILVIMFLTPAENSLVMHGLEVFDTEMKCIASLKHAEERRLEVEATKPLPPGTYSKIACVSPRIGPEV